MATRSAAPGTAPGTAPAAAPGAAPGAASAAADRAPFRFDGDDRGVLLLHGFTGSPFEMRPLGEALAAAGYSVVGPSLAGHDGTVPALAATGWRDWYGTAERAFDELRARTRKVAVVGLSMGALLTVELARARAAEVAAVGLLAPALRLGPWLERLIRLTAGSRFLSSRAFPKWGGSDIADPAMKARNPAAAGFPVRALGSLLDCMTHARTHLGEVEAPAFVAHARHDHTIPFAAMAEVVRDLATDAPDELVLERSFHVITLDVERQLLFDRLLAFLARHL